MRRFLVALFLSCSPFLQAASQSFSFCFFKEHASTPRLLLFRLLPQSVNVKTPAAPLRPRVQWQVASFYMVAYSAESKKQHKKAKCSITRSFLWLFPPHFVWSAALTTLALLLAAAGTWHHSTAWSKACVHVKCGRGRAGHQSTDREVWCVSGRSARWRNMTSVCLTQVVPSSCSI